MMYDLTVIGNGIAANVFLAEYLKKANNVLQIHSPDKAPPCSLNTTGTVVLDGVRMGVSPLGDLIFKSFEAFTNYYNTHQPTGVDPARFFLLTHGDGRESESEFTRRFGSFENIETPLKTKDSHTGKEWGGFVINPGPFMEYLENKKLALNPTIQKDLLTGMEKTKEGITLKLLSGETVLTKKVLLATGAYTKIYETIYPPKEEISKSKILPGSYLESEMDLGASSFAIQKNRENLIYHGPYKKLVLGATQQKNLVQAPDYQKLAHIHQSFSDLLEMELPELSTFKVKSGIRHKGVRRKPFWGELDKDVYGFFSLYKKGLSFPFFAVNELLEKML